MKTLWTIGVCAALAAVVAAPSLAGDLRGRIQVVDANKGTVTVVEGGKNYTYTATGDTKFLSVKGAALVNGIRSGDLKPGRRVVVSDTLRDGKDMLTTLQIRP